MKTRRTYLGMVGVVSLALGANANAIIFNLDDTPKSTTYYAKETLTEDQKGKDGATYYEVNSGETVVKTNGVETKGGFVVEGEVGLGGPSGTVLRIRYDFTNMVLSDEPTLEVYEINKDMRVKNAGVFLSVSGVLRSGGGTGASSVSFIVTRTDGMGTDGKDALEVADITSKLSEAVLTIKNNDNSGDDDGTIAVSPDAPVSIKMTVTDDLGGTADEHTSSYPAAIRVGEALVAKSKPKNATASVVEDFMRFKDQTSPTSNPPVLKVNLGTFSISLGNPTGKSGDGINYLNAKDAGITTPGHLIKVGTEATSTAAATGSFATVQGDFSFASKVTLGTNDDTACSDTAADMLIRDTAGEVTNTTGLMPFSIDPAATNQALCIHVDGETVIPRGGTLYSVALGFEPEDASAKFPPTDRSLNLGRIRHDGTAVRFPYLTTYPGYNQRIVIVNEGEAVRYNFDFTSEADVSATPLGAAAGMLPARQTTVLRVGDIVEVMGGSRTAGTLTIVADPATVEVAVTQVNLETRGTDTLYVDAEPNLE